MDQVFAVLQMWEKYPANRIDVFYAFINFENAYATIDGHGKWQMWRVYAVGGKLPKACSAEFLFR